VASPGVEGVSSGVANQALRISVFSAAYFAHAGFFNPFLPLWLKELGFGIVVISALTAVQSVTRMLAPYAWGALSDRTGERVKLLRIGAFIALAFSSGLWFNGGTWWVGLVLLLMFAQTSGMMPMTEASLAHVVTVNGVFDTKRYGRVRLWGSIGFMVAVLGAGAWFESFGMHYFPLAANFTLVVLVLAAYGLADAKETPHPQGETAVSIRHVLQQRQVQWLFASIFFHVLSHMGVYTFFSLYLDALGYSKSTIGLLWAVSVIVEIGWFFTQSRWLPRFTLTGWLVVCAAVMAFRMTLTAAAPQVIWLLVLAQALHALTFAAHHSCCIALLSHHFPGRLRTRGQALYSVIGYGIPGMVGSVLGGLMGEHWGLGSVFWATACTSLFAMGCAIVVWRMQHSAQGAKALPM